MGEDISSAKPHYLGHRKRLKEKLLKGGAAFLADYEMVELILSLSITRKDVKPLAKELLARFGSFSAILDATPEQLSEVKGIGENSVGVIRLIKDSSIKYLRERSKGKNVLSSPEALIDYCRMAMVGLKDEEFRVIYLSSKNEVIEDEALFKGAVDQTAVYPRKVIERALYHNATALIFVHNHPSGALNPSRADLALTKLLKDAAEALQIKVHDHLIVTKEGHYSFAREGRL